MKKISIILLLVSYSLATMGISLNQFYCCGKLKSVTVTLSQDIKQKCSKKGCCENKYQFVKVKDNHVTANEMTSPVKNFTNLHSFDFTFEDVIPDYQMITVANKINAPPLYSHVPIYIYNCVFRV